MNLGSPDSPEAPDVRRFLEAFLSDPKVVDFPRALWMPILHGIVLRVRPKNSGELYRSIWSEQGSPLVFYTQRQRELLEEALPQTRVRLAMTYTSPLIEESLDALCRDGVEDITVLPLFPHHAPSSTGSIVEQTHSFFATHPDTPPYRIVAPFPSEQAYVRWHAQQLAQAITAAEADAVVLSYHGVPERRVHEPVEYRRQCEETTEAITEHLSRMGIEVPVMTTFQSKFGPGRWLQPATMDTMKALPGRGVTSLVVATPGFVADCIETIDELDRLNQDTFMHAGGQRFMRVAPINDDPVIIDMVKNLIEVHEGADR